MCERGQKEPSGRNVKQGAGNPERYHLHAMQACVGREGDASNAATMTPTWPHSNTTMDTAAEEEEEQQEEMGTRPGSSGEWGSRLAGTSSPCTAKHEM